MSLTARLKASGLAGWTLAHPSWGVAGLLLGIALVGCGNSGPARHEGASFAVSQDGKTVVWTTGPGAGNSVKIRDAAGKIRVLATGAYFEGPTISPDGKYVLVATGNAFRARLTITKIEVATGKRTPFAETEGESHYSPTYSPDGMQVAFRGASKPRSERFGGVQWLDYDLYLADATSKYEGRTERLTGFKSERMTAPRWSPDGKLLTVAASDRDGRIWLRGIDAGGNALSSGPISSPTPVWEFEGQNNESMPVYLGNKVVIVSDRANVGRYQIGYLDIVKGGFTPITKEEGYFIDPQVANGKIYVLEDVTHKMRFRIAELDPATGNLKEFVPESEFDERK